MSPDASDEDAFDNANKFVGAINGRNDLTDADKSTQIVQLQNDLAASTLSKTFNQALNESGTLGATELLNAAQFDENIQNNPRLSKQINRLRETVSIQETKNTLAQSAKQADQIFTDYDDETNAKTYINQNFDANQAPMMNAIITQKFDEKRSADKRADANTWRAIDLVYKGNPDELFKFIELGKTKQSRDAMLRYAVDKIAGKKPTSNPKLYATLLSKTPEQIKQLDANIFRNDLSADEFKNVTQLYSQKGDAPGAIKTALDFAVENYPFNDLNVAGLGFKNNDDETIDLGQVQKSEFLIKAKQTLERQQQLSGDQPLTETQIERTLKTVELATMETSGGLGLGQGITGDENAINKILNSGNVIVNAVDDTQQTRPEVSISEEINSFDGSESLSVSVVGDDNAQIDSTENPNQIRGVEIADSGQFINDGPSIGSGGSEIVEVAEISDILERAKRYIGEKQVEAYQLHLNRRTGILGLDENQQDITERNQQGVKGSIGFNKGIELGASAEKSSERTVVESNNSNGLLKAQYTKRFYSIVNLAQRKNGGFQLGDSALDKISLFMDQLVSVTTVARQKVDNTVTVKNTKSELLPAGALNDRTINGRDITLKERYMTTETKSKTSNMLEFYRFDRSKSNIEGLAAYRVVFGPEKGLKKWISINGLKEQSFVSDKEISAELLSRRE